MLDRSLLRTRELAIRASVGGSRGAAGPPVAGRGDGDRRRRRRARAAGARSRGVARIPPPIPADALPYWLDYSDRLARTGRADWRLAALTVLVFALVPALQASKTDVIAVSEGWRTIELAGPPPHPGDHVPRGADRAVRRAAGALRGRPAQRRTGPGLGRHLRPPRHHHRDRHAAGRDVPDAGGPRRVLRHPARSPSWSPAFAAAALTTTVPLSGGESRSLTIDGKSFDRREDETATR